MRKVTLIIAALAVALAFAGCTESDADVASKNISKAAEQFEVHRTIVFYNGITDKFIATVEGFCSVETGDALVAGSLEVTCKNGKGFWRSNFGLSDNTTYTVLQTEPISVSTKRVRVIFKPESMIPNIDRP